MTPEDRRQAFTDAYNTLVQRFGFAVVCWQEPRQLGPVIQVEVKTDIQPVQGWTEPTDIPGQAPSRADRAAPRADAGKQKE